MHDNNQKNQKQTKASSKQKALLIVITSASFMLSSCYSNSSGNHTQASTHSVVVPAVMVPSDSSAIEVDPLSDGVLLSVGNDQSANEYYCKTDNKEIVCPSVTLTSTDKGLLKCDSTKAVSGADEYLSCYQRHDGVDTQFRSLLDNEIHFLAAADALQQGDIQG